MRCVDLYKLQYHSFGKGHIGLEWEWPMTTVDGDASASRMTNAKCRSPPACCLPPLKWGPAGGYGTLVDRNQKHPNLELAIKQTDSSWKGG